MTSHLILLILVDYTRRQQSDTCHRIKITALRRKYQNQFGTRVILYRVLNWGLKHHYSNTVGIRIPSDKLAPSHLTEDIDVGNYYFESYALTPLSFITVSIFYLLHCLIISLHAYFNYVISKKLK